MNFALSRRSRSLMLQMLFVLGVAALLTGLILNARERLAAAGLTSGFGFLFRATGWEVGFSVISMTAHDPYWRAFLAGGPDALPWRRAGPPERHSACPWFWPQARVTGIRRRSRKRTDRPAASPPR